MIPRRAAAAPALRPSIGSSPLPTLPAPTTRRVRDLELLATDYATEHATATGIPRERLALAAFDELARHAQLVAARVDAVRWSTRPPAPGVLEARSRLATPAPF